MARRLNPQDQTEPAHFGHEKLHVYQENIGFVSWGHDVVSGVSTRTVAKDHFSRSSESSAWNIALANSRRTKKERDKYLFVAYGSCLECAACLDIFGVQRIVSSQDVAVGKEKLLKIGNMLLALARSDPFQTTRDRGVPYPIAPHSARDGVFFVHEKLDVYRIGLGFVAWVPVFASNAGITAAHATQLDKQAVSIVLNIAEGNGRLSTDEHCQFIDTASTSALQAASCLDIIEAKKQATSQQTIHGKRLLRRICPMLVALRKSLKDKQRNGDA